jgi:hypothetical protein
MVCPDCKSGKHCNRPATHCDCQHKGPSEKYINRKQIELDAAKASDASAAVPEPPPKKVIARPLTQREIDQQRGIEWLLPNGDGYSKWRE